MADLAFGAWACAPNVPAFRCFVYRRIPVAFIGSMLVDTDWADFHYYTEIKMANLIDGSILRWGYYWNFYDTTNFALQLAHGRENHPAR